MAIAYTIIEERPDLRETIVDITLDASYSAGGYALDNAQLGMQTTPDAVICSHYHHPTSTAHLVPDWDPANNKLQVFVWGGTSPDPLVEAASGDIAATHKVRLVVKGTPRL